MRKYIVWVGVMFLQLVFWYLGVLHEEIWAGNVLIFLAWLQLFCGVTSLVAADLNETFTIEPRTKLITKLDPYYDVGFAMLLAAAGWWWTASAYLLGNLLMVAVHKRVDERKGGTGK